MYSWYKIFFLFQPSRQPISVAYAKIIFLIAHQKKLENVKLIKKELSEIH